MTEDTSATLMSSTNPDSAYPVSVGITEYDGSYTYQAVLMFDREFSECIVQVKLKRGSTELRMYLYDVDHKNFSYASKENCLTLVESSGSTLYQSQVTKKAPTLTYTALAWFRSLLVDPAYDFGVDPVSDVHLNNLR